MEKLALGVQNRGNIWTASRPTYGIRAVYRWHNSVYILLLSSLTARPRHQGQDQSHKCWP